MELSKYESICGEIPPGTSKEELLAVALRHNTNFDAVSAIYSQRMQKVLKEGQREAARNVASFLRRHREGASIVDMTRRSPTLSACTLARLLLANGLLPGLDKPQDKGAFTEYLRDPLRLWAEWERQRVKVDPAREASEAALWWRVVQEIGAAVIEDRLASPFLDKIRLNSGLEYELRLYEQLANLGAVFKTENDLRDQAQGGDKTPDVKLEMPLLLRATYGPPRLVNWIDSKATFGDPEAHAANLAQFRGYVNRFQSGLVIYWLGHVDELNTPRPGSPYEELARDVLVLSALPPPHETRVLGWEDVRALNHPPVREND